MKGFDVLHVKSAVKGHNKFDLSRSHLTTLNFGEILPLLSEETIPGDKFSLSASYFSRMAPLVVPTYGKFAFKTLEAFVPYHQVAVDAEAWLAGKTVWEGQTPKHRYITIASLARFFELIGSSVDEESELVQFIMSDEDGDVSSYTFEGASKYFFKVLTSLGYTVPTFPDFAQASDWATTIGARHLSAYPLLAFFKLYNDYMSQSQRYNTSVLSDILYKVKYGISISNKYDATRGEINEYLLLDMFQQVRLNFENDYFTSAWQNPNSPLADLESVATSPVPANADELIGVDVNNSYLMESGGSPGNFVTLTQRALDFLKSFDDWVRRNNYTGSRAVQQVYSRFGIKTDDYRSHYAHVFKTDSQPIQVGDVTATASTQSEVLGDYAGKGIMNAGSSSNFEFNDYGMFFVFGYFTVVPMNPYGFDRKVLRSEPLDYYNPEFDGIGADAISVGEVTTDPLAFSSSSVKDTSVFGFTERYNAYRYGRDLITGEFRNLHNSNIMNSWHTGRNLIGIRRAGNLVAQSTAMNTLEMENSQFNRIFNITGDYVDHFYLTCQFKLDAIRPILNLNQVVRLGEGDTVVPRNGNVIS